jgi:single-strand DNA-binding protein
MNIAVIRGIVSSEPHQRTLPSGDLVTNLDVTTDLDHGTCSVPVVVHGTAISVGTGDDVVVTGHVARRFFRAGGATQSRTELVAEHVLKASQRRRVERLVADVASRLTR